MWYFNFPGLELRNWGREISPGTQKVIFLESKASLFENVYWFDLENKVVCNLGPGYIDIYMYILFCVVVFLLVVSKTLFPNLKSCAAH